MRKAILLLSIVGFLIFYVNKPLWDKPETFKVEKVEDNKNVITEWEVASFLEVWPQYVNSFVSRFDVHSLSLTTSKNLKKKLSYITIAWLNRKGWEADRFFYVEERLKMIVNVTQTQEHSLQIIDILERQKATEKNPSTVENINSLIKQQKENMNLQYVTKKEIDIVRPYVNNIAEVLDLKYQKNKVAN